MLIEKYFRELDRPLYAHSLAAAILMYMIVSCFTNVTYVVDGDFCQMLELRLY